MKNAWKSAGGYSIASWDEHFFLRTADAEISLPARLLPRKALALLVEHVGTIPKAGESFKCSKARGAQSIITGLEQGEHEELMKKAQAAEERVKQTKIEYNGLEIWQTMKTLRIIAMDGDLTEIIDEKRPSTPYMAGNLMIWIDGETVAAIARYKMEEAAAQFLGSFQWIE